VPVSPQLAGFPPENRHHGPEPEPATLRPAAQGWLSDELIADTRRVWSSAYGRVISTEILNNVRRLADVLVRAERERKP